MRVKEVFAWGMYDLANTAFSALFVTFFYPFYIKQFLGGDEFQIGLVFGLSMLLVGLLVPAIGAWSDRIGKRMPFIIAFTMLCCLFTWLVIYAGLFLALVFGLLANFFYHAALTTYNALIPLIAKKKEYGWVSGVGVGMGYFGTLLSLVMAAIILNNFGWETLEGVKTIFPATAVFFLAFGSFMFFRIKEKKVREREGFVVEIAQSFAQVWRTVKHLPKHKGLIPLLFSMFLFVDAMMAVIVFLFLYGRTEIGLSVQNFMWVYAFFSVAAVAGSFGFGKLIDVIGAKKGLAISGVIWIITILSLILVKGLPTFLVSGVLGGIALGGVWTGMRPMLIELSPARHVGQFFGFLELANKFSGVLGPILFGFLAANVSYAAGLFALLGFFVLGLFVLKFVPGRHYARS